VGAFNSSSERGTSNTSTPRDAFADAFTGAFFLTLSAELPFAFFVAFDGADAGAFACGIVIEFALERCALGVIPSYFFCKAWEGCVGFARCFDMVTRASEGVTAAGAAFDGCVAFGGLLTVEATACIGLGLCEGGRALIVLEIGSGTLSFGFGAVFFSTGIRRIGSSFFEVFAMFKTSSSSEGTSNMSALVLGARDLPSNAPPCVCSACLFRNPFWNAVFFRGRSGDGASLFEAGASAGAGAGIVVRREDLP
jgi:hypothetical protein